jgi:hypothetical protein
MRGIPQFNFPAFDAARDFFHGKLGHEVISPADMDRAHGIDGLTPIAITPRLSDVVMKRDIEALFTCDAIALLPGWEKSKGVAVELALAKYRGLKVLDATTGLEFSFESPPTLAVRYPKTFVDGPTSTPIDVTSLPGEKASNPKDIIGSSKLPLHLFPTTAIAAGCLAFLEGAVKYGRSNWRAVGVRASIYHDALLRHMTAWWEGEDTDPDSGLPHLSKAIACIAILIDAKAAGKLTDDRAVEGGYVAFAASLTPHVARLKAMHTGKTPRHYTIADNTSPLPETTHGPKIPNCPCHYCRS